MINFETEAEEILKKKITAYKVNPVEDNLNLLTEELINELREASKKHIMDNVSQTYLSNLTVRLAASV